MHKLILLLSPLLLCTQVRAVKPSRPVAAKDKTLVSLFARLKNMEGLAYQTTVIRSIAGQPKEADTMVMVSYQSRESVIQFSRSTDFIFFFNRDGQFRVNLKDREIYAKTFGADSASQHHLKDVIEERSSLPVDSLLLTGAVISSRVSSPGMVSYRLKYPAGSPVSEFSLSYNLHKDQFERITCSMERKINAGPGDPVAIRQTLTMSNYSNKIPEEAERLAAVSGNLLSYLKETYPGFRINQL